MFFRVRFWDFKLSNELPTLSIAESMAMAWRHHAAGTLHDAGMISARVLKLQPGNPDALHLLGVMAYQAGDQERAIQLISEAIRGAQNLCTHAWQPGIGEIGQGGFERRGGERAQGLWVEALLRRRSPGAGAGSPKEGPLEEAVQEFERAKALGLDTADLENHLARAREQSQASAGHRPTPGGTGLRKDD